MRKLVAETRHAPRAALRHLRFRPSVHSLGIGKRQRAKRVPRLLPEELPIREIEQRMPVDDVLLMLPLPPRDADPLRHAKEFVDLPRRQKRLLAPLGIRPEISN